MAKSRGVRECCMMASVLVHLLASALGLENGLGLTPVMAWSSWNYFGNGINETIVLETADALAPFVNFVQVFLGHGDRPVAETLSWESRCVGNIRAINAGLLDAYLLKSMDGAPGSGATVINFRSVVSESVATLNAMQHKNVMTSEKEAELARKSSPVSLKGAA